MQVSLFATCLVDLFFPAVGISVVRTLRRHGVSVDFPPDQTCCGQPAFNSGFQRAAEKVAAVLIKTFAHSQYVVTPSGSCAAMVRQTLPTLFADQPALRAAAADLAGRTYEFCEFLTDVLDLPPGTARMPGRAVYHRSCHMSRMLGVVEAPYRLLGGVTDLELADLPGAEDCCGFGGTFAVKMAPISVAMADAKLRNILSTGATLLVGADMGCLMHLGGRISRLGLPLRVLHVAQVLDEGAVSG